MHFNLPLFLLIFLVIVEAIPDHYKTLDVSQNASKDEIKKAYKKLMLKYHPDKNKNDPKALETTQKINAAYDILKDDEARKNHDNELRSFYGYTFKTSGGSSTMHGESSTPPEGSFTRSDENSSTSPDTTPDGTSPKGTEAYTNSGILL
uniref:J domain-containing protein n=1 Tax=Meloidogyne enterolobii TaxID=390850 RepID=A0A6V7UFC3_MELEN|nr:unnamed protein product [Meloidogyne enterolobii]